MPAQLEGHQDPQTVWMTCICTCLLSFYESKMQKEKDKAAKAKEKELEKKAIKIQASEQVAEVAESDDEQ